MRTLSVLIAAYQAQDWLEQCLDSVFSQQLPEGWQMQILLGIDGCEDTLTLAKTIKHPKLSRLYLKHNQGTYVTFNTLMRYASGELIARFDADDVMKQHYLYAQIQALENNIDMTMTWSIFTDAKLQPTSYVLAHEVYHPENGLNRRGTEGQFTIKRKIWEHLGGFRAWRCGADTDFFKRLRIAGFTHCVIEQFLYFRRTHNNSLTAHPDSNFQSPLRLSIQKLTDEYQRQYQTGERHLKISPEYAKSYAHL